jgi:hypothetical protein
LSGIGRVVMAVTQRGRAYAGEDDKVSVAG